MNRFTFIFYIASGFIGVGLASAQTAPKLPESPRLVPTVAAKPSPVASPKPVAPITARSTGDASAKSAKEPEPAKIVRLYRGGGFFDAGLAQKLRPALVKAFGLTPETPSRPADTGSPDVLRLILGSRDGSEKSADQESLAKTRPQ